MGLLSNLVLLTAAVAVAADPATPKISSISFSGNGCLNDPKFSGNFDVPCLTFSNFAAALPGNNKTVNCQVHLQTQGATPGWQVALKSNVVKGHVVLSPGTTLTHYTTVFFSQDASNTVSPDRRHAVISAFFSLPLGYHHQPIAAGHSPTWGSTPFAVSNQDTFSNTIENKGTTAINKPVTLVGNADGGKVWSPCTGSDGSTGIMNINFRGALAGDGEAYFEANTEEWDLEWRKC
ncbi:hypothetical protein MYCTH_91276 [Thermothelomyces thermophilus ATCC 42464]|uniref:Secreted protein n=1 Tax=Thermothelomyces thermophilus (strain ATCC 42464 / BCRC 31852 / DSM 1799) TaxID=573729 RepID=G2Q5E6_THET4|nr:uncharacterized protein MYCTH_91276 [Thermothelomyces thermophilus ATCC 42464]AEO53777.1 hypothetical protein MYCTH_91276 [Thermothelomyces thermophilus ATCC 42464]